MYHKGKQTLGMLLESYRMPLRMVCDNSNVKMMVIISISIRFLTCLSP